MKPSLIVTLADKNYINHAKQLFSSVYWNAGWKGDYMLLAHEIPEADLTWFREKGILIKECKPLFPDSFFNEYPNTVLDKFYLFTDEFKKWDNIVFLDSDIIVRYSLEKLTKLEGFNAIPEYHNFFLKDQFTGSIEKEFSENVLAFNVGVFSFNISIIEEDSFDRLLELFTTYKEVVKYPEQAIMNLHFYKKWKRLNFLYNITIPTMIQYYHAKPLKIDGPALHFCGKDKPWNSTNPFYKEWKINLDRADLIDLNNRQKGRAFKMTNMIFYSIYYYCNRILWNLYYFIDRQIGRIGILLRK